MMVILVGRGSAHSVVVLMLPDDSGTRGELVDLATAQFEKDLAKVLLKYKDVEPETVRVEVKVRMLALTSLNVLFSLL